MSTGDPGDPAAADRAPAPSRVPSTAARVTVVGEDADAVRALGDVIAADGFHVTPASSLRRAVSVDPSTELLVLHVPELDPFAQDLVRMVRSRSRVLLLVVAEKADEEQVVSALVAGADDVVSTPFSVPELLARARSMVRGAALGSGHVVVGDEASAGPVHVDVAAHVVRVRGQEIRLPPREFDLLELLVRHAGRVVPRRRILDELWQRGRRGDAKSLDTHVKRLRAKVELDARDPRHIITVRGVGYRFDP